MNRLFAPVNPLGRTGFKATILGIGDVADRSVPIEQCVATVRRALDAGLNVIDTAPGYEDGYSEEIVGRAIAGRRRDVFVIDKIDHHEQPVEPQVLASLSRLGVEQVDAMVLHGLSTLEGWRKACGPGGAMEQLAAEIARGRCRFRGISSHDPDVLAAAIESGLCDVVMFAVGPWCDRRYVRQILPLARERGVATVCFKTFGAGKLLGDTAGYGRPLQRRPRGKFSSGGLGAGEATLPRLTVRECVHYTLTCGPDVALLGMSFANEQDAAFAAAGDFAPLDEATMADIGARAAGAIEGKGPCWWNPDGR
jgi:aryl-alcohol dehydrogenase-like predicted oxidoreductase